MATLMCLIYTCRRLFRYYMVLTVTHQSLNKYLLRPYYRMNDFTSIVSRLHTVPLFPVRPIYGVMRFNRFIGNQCVGGLSRLAPGLGVFPSKQEEPVISVQNHKHTAPSRGYSFFLSNVRVCAGSSCAVDFRSMITELAYSGRGPCTTTYIPQNSFWSSNLLLRSFICITCLFIIRSALNGSNGEYTRTDDLSMNIYYVGASTHEHGDTRNKHATKHPKDVSRRERAVLPNSDRTPLSNKGKVKHSKVNDSKGTFNDDRDHPVQVPSIIIPPNPPPPQQINGQNGVFAGTCYVEEDFAYNGHLVPFEHNDPRPYGPEWPIQVQTGLDALDLIRVTLRGALSFLPTALSSIIRGYTDPICGVCVDDFRLYSTRHSSSIGRKVPASCPCRCALVCTKYICNSNMQDVTGCMCRELHMLALLCKGVFPDADTRVFLAMCDLFERECGEPQHWHKHLIADARYLLKLNYAKRCEFWCTNIEIRSQINGAQGTCRGTCYIVGYELCVDECKGPHFHPRAPFDGGLRRITEQSRSARSRVALCVEDPCFLRGHYHPVQEEKVEREHKDNHVSFEFPPVIIPPPEVIHNIAHLAVMAERAATLRLRGAPPAVGPLLGDVNIPQAEEAPPLEPLVAAEPLAPDVPVAELAVPIAEPGIEVPLLLADPIPIVVEQLLEAVIDAVDPDTRCCVCFMPWGRNPNDAPVATLLDCRHVICLECRTIISNINPLCPMCRHPFTVDPVVRALVAVPGFRPLVPPPVVVYGRLFQPMDLGLAELFVDNSILERQASVLAAHHGVFELPVLGHGAYNRYYPGVSQSVPLINAALGIRIRDLAAGIIHQREVFDHRCARRNQVRNQFNQPVLVPQLVPEPPEGGFEGPPLIVNGIDATLTNVNVYYTFDFNKRQGHWRRFVNHLKTVAPFSHKETSYVLNDYKAGYALPESLQLQNSQLDSWRFGTTYGNRKPYSIECTTANALLIANGFKSFAGVTIFKSVFEYLSSLTSNVLIKLNYRSVVCNFENKNAIRLSFIDAARKVLCEMVNADRFASLNREMLQNTLHYYIQQKFIEGVKDSSVLPPIVGVVFGQRVQSSTSLRIRALSELGQQTVTLTNRSSIMTSS